MEDIIRVGKKAYPHEGCGFLLGSRGQDREAQVLRVREAQNTNADRPRDRFEIDPKEFMQVDRQAEKDGEEIVGFFHSHPDHPDRPSGFDREMAWPRYSYLIVSVMGGTEVSARSWVLAEDNGEFQEEELRVGG